MNLHRGPEIWDGSKPGEHFATQTSSVPIPIPPLAEQRPIVAKVDQLMALVDELKTQLAASRATAKYLLQALVAELTGGGARSSKDPLGLGRVRKTSPKASAVQ